MTNYNLTYSNQFSADDTTATIATYGLIFNTGSVKALDYAAYAKFFLNEEKKQLVVQGFDHCEDYCTYFYDPDYGYGKIARVSSCILVRIIASLCGWDLKKTSYRVKGTYIKDQSLMLFDLNNALPIIHN